MSGFWLKHIFVEEKLGFKSLKIKKKKIGQKKKGKSACGPKYVSNSVLKSHEFGARQRPL